MSDRRWCPDKCPITGRPFFCWIEDEDGTQVPTYGGPFDSYTIPEQDEDGEFTVKHYDHDLGGWRDYMNLGVRLIEDQREDHEWGTVEALQARIAELDAAIALMRGQSWQPISTAPNDRIHVRGLWVRMRRDACPDEMEWRQYVGYIEDETGRFVDPEYGEDFGWEADDYDCWMELPAPPKQKDSADEQ